MNVPVSEAAAETVMDPVGPAAAVVADDVVVLDDDEQPANTAVATISGATTTNHRRPCTILTDLPGHTFLAFPS